MIRYLCTAALLGLISSVRSAADDKPAAAPSKATPPEAGSLPADVLLFHGTVTATVVSVDAEKTEMKVKVTSAAPDPAKNKAPKPEALAGMTITVTPLQVKKSDGKSVLDEAGSAYIKGARPGDPVTIPVRASSKGVVFRLLKVPSAAGK
jgi:hypothetical protein